MRNKEDDTPMLPKSSDKGFADLCGNKKYNVALYMRLSKDDDGATESASIMTQRKMLHAYARENGFIVVSEYIDDGWTGTNFDRPSFKRMIADIEAGKVNMVITKDFSRLGRDYITAGQYTEMFFPERGVRYIAITDGYDSINPYNDIAPFKHVINEMYARDTSKKIRSAFVTKMKEGSYIGSFAPYGFKKDNDNKNHLVVDYEVAPVVREIFQMAADGCRPVEIAKYLTHSGIASPVIYRCQTHPHLNPEKYTTRKEWTSSTIVKILANVVYIGHTAQGKTSKPSFKSKTAFRKPRDEWYIVKNTHESIITQDVFDIVRKRSVSRHMTPKTDFKNAFSGIAKCADCGGNMSITGTHKAGSTYNLVCGRYKLYGSRECTNHFIDYDFLYKSVLSEIKEMLVITEKEKIQVLADIEKTKRNESRSNTHHESVDLEAKIENRNKELDNLIKRLYEDNVNGKINDERFVKLSTVYETEQQEITRKLKMLKKTSVQEIETKPAYQQLFDFLDGLANTKELTSSHIKRLIDRIEIGQGIYEKTPEGKKKRQTVKVYWRFKSDFK